MQICPVDRPWLHTYVFEPYLQGCELINLAWNGVDHSLERNPLSMAERAIYWLQGVSLMLPLVNTIIWLAWQAFGSPEKLTDPFCPEIDYHPPMPAPQIIIHRQAEGGGEIEQFAYAEKTDNSEMQIAWLVNTSPTWIVATQEAREFSASAVYHPDYSLKELHHQQGAKKIDITRNTQNLAEVRVEISNGSQITTQKTLQIPQDAPLIQQRTLGLKPFVLSEKEEMEFYAVIPEYPPFAHWFPLLEATPCVWKFKATKKGEEEGLLKVEVVPMKGWPYNTVRGELWFDSTTGSLKKFIDSVSIIHRKVGELVQNNR